MLILGKYILASGNTFWTSNSSTWRSLVVLAPLSARILCSGVIRGVSSEAANIFLKWTSLAPGKEWHSTDGQFVSVLLSIPRLLPPRITASDLSEGICHSFWFSWMVGPRSDVGAWGLSLLGHPRVWWWEDCTLCGWTWVWRWWEWLCYGLIQCVWFPGWSFIHFLTIHRCRKVKSW